jgi:hypothetical protein
MLSVRLGDGSGQILVWTQRLISGNGQGSFICARQDVQGGIFGTCQKVRLRVIGHGTQIWAISRGPRTNPPLTPHHPIKIEYSCPNLGSLWCLYLVHVLGNSKNRTEGGGKRFKIGALRDASKSAIGRFVSELKIVRPRREMRD